MGGGAAGGLSNNGRHLGSYQKLEIQKKKITITKLVSKSARGMNEQLLKTSGADVLSSRETTEENLMWEGGGTPLPPVVYPRVNL